MRQVRRSIATSYFLPDDTYRLLLVALDVGVEGVEWEDHVAWHSDCPALQLPVESTLQYS